MAQPHPRWTGARARRASRHMASPRRLLRDGRALRRLLGAVQDGEQVVDLGAGGGLLTLAVRRRHANANVVAVDSSPDMLGDLRARATDAGLDGRVTTLQADAAHTGLPAASADVVLSTHLLHEVAGPAPIIVEAARLLRPGGRLAVADFHDGWLGWYVRWTHPAECHGPVAAAWLRDALVHAGLSEVRTEVLGRLVVGLGRRPTDAARSG